MKTVTVKLPDSLDAKVATLASHRGETKSEIIREALDALCANTESNAAVSCLDLAGNLAGSLEGPRDLSSHPRHLKGYGQ